MYTKNDFTSTDSEVESQADVNGDSSIVRLRGSPGASSTASDSPTPTNSIQERSWGVPGIYYFFWSSSFDCWLTKCKARPIL